MDEELLEWAIDKHRRVALVIPAVSKDPWTIHGNEHVCVGCLPIFTGHYLADIPEVMREMND